VAVANQTATVVGVFNSVQDAHDAIRHLEQQGFSRDDVSLVANRNARGFEHMSDEDKSAMKDKTSDVIADAGIGAAIGGVGGLLLSIAGIAIPGIGPILAAGPIAAALTGAGIGAAGGGIIGALTESGIPEEHAHYYSESVRRGDILVMVRATGERAERACDILDDHGAVDVDERVRNWQTRGWAGRYDESAEPYTRDQLESERSFYGSTMAGTTGYMDDNAHMARTETSGTGTSRSGMSQEEGWRDRGEKGDREHIDGGLSSLGGVPGLGRDTMGRKMPDSASTNLREQRGDYRHEGEREVESGRKMGERMVGGGGTGVHRSSEGNTGPAAYSQDIDYDRDRRAASGASDDLRQSARETGRKVSGAMEGRPDHPGDRPGVGDDVKRAGGRAKKGAKDAGAAMSRGLEGRPDHSGDRPGIGDDVRRAGERVSRSLEGRPDHPGDKPGIGDDVERGWDNIKRGASRLYRRDR
jgi:hypothetical protein